MNKTTRPIEDNEYDAIIEIIRDGFEFRGISHKPNPRIAMALQLERNLGFENFRCIETYIGFLCNTTSYEYDLNGNTTRGIDSEGVVTAEYIYDCMGKVLQEKDASGIVATYSYNRFDLVEKVTLTSPTGNN